MLNFLSEAEFLIFGKAFLLLLVFEILIFLLGMLLMIVDANNNTGLNETLVNGTFAMAILGFLGFLAAGLLALIWFVIF